MGARRRRDSNKALSGRTLSTRFAGTFPIKGKEREIEQSEDSGRRSPAILGYFFKHQVSCRDYPTAPGPEILESGAWLFEHVSGA